MELHQLETFLAIARTGHLTRAARELSASQPAVSAQLKALEEELGLALFLRTPRGMELTEAGRRLRAKAEQVMTSAAELVGLAGAMAGRVVERCTIGLNTEAGVLRVAALVDALSAAAPDLGVDLLQGLTRTILDDVSAGRLTAGFAFGPVARPELRTLALARLELVVAVPVAWRERIDGRPLDEVLRQPWVWPPADCPFHGRAVALARAGGAAVDAGVAADQESTILRLVAAGVGVSLVPAALVRGRAEQDVVAVPLQGVDVELAFVWRARESASPAVRVLVEAVGSVWGVNSRG